MLYRALALESLKRKIDLEDEALVAEVARSLDLLIKETVHGENRILLNKEDVTSELRSHRVNNSVSIVAKHAAARREITELQRQIISSFKNVILDGRDIGTVVLPDADFKFYLDASVDERARRRWLEIKEKNVAVSVDEVRDGITRRDYIDSNRKEAPLLMAADAFYVDTTSLSFTEVVDKICAVIRSGNR